MKRTSPAIDLSGNVATLAAVWGLPVAAMFASVSLPHPTKTLVWAAALIWMGTACLINARRRRRVHCYFAGPFFFLMTVPVLLHGYQIIWLGPAGWKWLGLTIGVAGGGAWCLTEKIFGTHFASDDQEPTADRN